MKHICVTLTTEEKNGRGEIAENHNTTPGELLVTFVADLTCSDRSDGGVLPIAPSGNDACCYLNP